MHAEEVFATRTWLLIDVIWNEDLEELKNRKK
jgi:hypothetical protein